MMARSKVAETRQVLREEPVNTPMVELGGIEPPSIRR